MTYTLVLIPLLAILTIAAYVDRVYSEMGKFLAREYQDNVDSWEEFAEPRLRLGRESLALSASVLRQLTVAALALLWDWTAAMVAPRNAVSRTRLRSEFMALLANRMKKMNCSQCIPRIPLLEKRRSSSRDWAIPGGSDRSHVILLEP